MKSEDYEAAVTAAFYKPYSCVFNITYESGSVFQLQTSWGLLECNKLWLIYIYMSVCVADDPRDSAHPYGKWSVLPRVLCSSLMWWLIVFFSPCFRGSSWHHRHDWRWDIHRYDVELLVVHVSTTWCVDRNWLIGVSQSNYVELEWNARAGRHASGSVSSNSNAESCR